MKFCFDFQLFKHKKVSLLLFILMIFLSLKPVEAQSVNNQIKMARALERSYNYEEALRIYQDIYKNNPRNMAVVAGIKNCYIGLQQYTTLVNFLEKIVNTPNSQKNWQVDLAEAYYLNNEREKASTLWKKFIDKNQTDPSAYRLVAGTMIRQRLFDQAISVYNQAINNLKRQEILHLDIANLYRAQLNYGKACEHYLQYYMFFPKQFTFVQNQLLMLSTKITDSSPVIDAILIFLEQYPNQSKIKEVLGGIYLKDKKYMAAFDVYKNLETNRSLGKFLYKYATEAYANDAFNHAIEGFEYIISNYPSSQLVPQVRFDLGRSHTALAYALDHNEESAKNMLAAVHIFENENLSNDNTIYALNGIIMLGNIYYNYYFDLDRAIKYYEQYLKLVSTGKSRDEVLIRLGDVYLTKNQSKQALEAYKRVHQKNLKVIASYKIAEIYFYNHQFSTASEHLTQLSIDTPADNSIMNDILSRNLLIKTFSQDSLILSKYADAELLKFQKKYTEAAEVFYEICQNTNNLQSLSGREAGKLYLKLKEYDRAKKVLDFLRTEIPEDKNFDEILFLLAESEDHLKNFNAAIALYHELMITFPNSLFIQSAREKARSLNAKISREQI